MAGMGGGGMGGVGGTPYTCGKTPGPAKKVDILLVIDNSASMSDKQQILSASVADLLQSYVNPRCLDANCAVASQPASPSDPCPAGSAREFAPVVDMHVGVITTSLGGHGSDTCLGDKVPSENDKGHLIDRKPFSGTVSTYQSLGFLAWDPTKMLQPPGTTSTEELAQTIGTIVQGAGEEGCGFESQLESWYRFAIDPDPYQSIQVVNNNANLVGIDNALLKQRKDFLRPDSLLLITLATDENECSVRDGSQYFFALQRYTPGGTTQYHLPKPRAACAKNPNDPCCRSCGQPPGQGCDTSQDNCDANKDGKPDPVSPQDDAINMRCFEQKRRFGIDFMQPTSRYADGLSKSTVPDRLGNLVQNPLFAGGQRTPQMVFLAGILGVPWQYVARRNANGKPDLLAGKDAKGNAVGGLMTADELAKNGVWPLIAGDVESYVPAKDPLMVESIEPRSGMSPITGDAIAPPNAGYYANAINGHEKNVPANDDLQYACIFKLPVPRECASAPFNVYCDCRNANETSKPLCQAPDGKYGTLQYSAKAYPARRELSLLSKIGAQAVVGSICPAQLSDPKSRDYGYRPGFAAMGEAMRGILAK
jgi:hypothetical protein